MISTPDIAPSAEWLDAWTGYELNLLALGRSPSTISSRRSEVLVMARHATAQQRSPSSVTRAQMQQYMLAQQRERKPNGYATLYENLRQFWIWYGAEYQVASPMEGIPRPRLAEVTTPVLTPAQVQAVLDATSGRGWRELRDRALILLLLESGLRRAELSALDIEDADIKARTLVVRRGKGGRARVAVFGDESAAALWRWLKARPQRASGAHRALFTSNRGDRLTPGGIAQAVRALGTRAGVPGLRPHLLRHAWAHYMLSDGAQEHDLMHLAGWTTTRQLGRYGAALARERALAAGKRHQVSSIVRSGRSAR